ncbi:MAG: DUF4065 domain-containing protein [Candidatus Peribacteria bacterium]|jgi:transcriptional regulator with XRE-family HTH domain|nr:DUF4065 domain-containing protein [Candidatus Peribacteria bacterium]
MPKKALAERIKSLRQKFNLSQADLATLLGMSRITYAQSEQGDRDFRHTELVTLANAFEMSIEELVREPLPAPLQKNDVTPDPFYKFKQAFLYLLSKCAQKPNVGKTVLNKLLYFADFNHYEKYRESITGINYVKMPRGPVPEIIESVIAQMEKEHQIQQVEVPYFQYTQQKIIPLIDADVGVFNGKELAELNYVIRTYGDRNADKLSEWSHGDKPWKTTEKF